MKHIIFISLLVAICGCSNKDLTKIDIEFDMFSMAGMERSVYEKQQLNKELLEFTGASNELRVLVQNTVDTLNQLEEWIIEKSGGYKEGREGSRYNLVNTSLKNPVGVIRDNPFGIDKNYLNRVSNFMVSKGFNTSRSVVDPDEDPIYEHEGIKGKDWFELAFEYRNIYQIISIFQELKLHYLYLEQKYLHSKLTPCNNQNTE